MARRFTYERVIATLVGSNEYYRLAGRTNTGFVDKAFADILGREPSASVENFFVGVAAHVAEPRSRCCWRRAIRPRPPSSAFSTIRSSAAVSTLRV